MEVAVKTEDRIARSDAELLRVVQAMIDRGMAPEMAAHVVAVALRSNDILTGLTYVPVND